MPLQDGDVAETSADITESQKDLGFDPKVPVEQGIKNFIAWYKQYNNFDLSESRNQEDRLLSSL